MSKKNRAIVEIGEQKYTFELDRQAVVNLEENIGFAITKVETQPVVQSGNLWVGGLQKNHPKLSFRARMDLLDAFQEEGGDVSEMVEFLVEQYASFLQTIPTDTKKKKKIIYE